MNPSKPLRVDFTAPVARSLMALFATLMAIGLASSAQALSMGLTGSDGSSNGVMAEVVSDGQTVTITFSDGPVALDKITISSLFAGEVAVVTVGDQSVEMSGRVMRRGGSVDMGGMVASQVTVTKTGWHSGLTVAGIRGDLSVGPVVDGPGPPVPEPSAALLFVVGMTVASASGFRRDRDDA